MEFRRELVSKGVSEAGAEQALLGQPVTSTQDQQFIKTLGYYVSPDGQVSLAKSLGPNSALPKYWLDRERAPSFGDTRTPLQISKAALLGKSAAPVLSGYKSFSATGASADALTALFGRFTQTTQGGKTSSDQALANVRAEIKKLEEQIAALQRQMEDAARAVEVELAKEAFILPLANPVTFPLFWALWSDWKKRVTALQAKLIELINKLPELFTKLVELKNKEQSLLRG